MANWLTDWWSGFGTSNSSTVSGQNFSGYADASEESFIRALGLNGISVKANHATAMGISTFFGCVRIISNLISSTPFGVYQKLKGGGSEGVGEHPLDYAIGTRPNRHMTPIVAMRTLVSNAIVYGWAIARIVKTGKDVNLYPYPTSWVSILEDTDTGFLFFEVVERGKKFYLTEDDVVFIKDLSFDGKKGVSIINWQSSTIKLSLLTSSFIDKYYEKGTFIGGFIEAPFIDVHNTDQTKAYKENVVKTLNSSEKGFGLAIMGSGGKWHPVTRSPVESQLMETFNRSDKDFAKIFGIPLSLIGDTEKQTSWGSGVEQMFIGVTRSVLVPLATQIEQEFNYKCFTRSEIQSGLYTKFNFWALLRGDSANYGAFVRTMVNIGAYSLDEVRAFDELPPIPDGYGKKHYIQGAMTPLDLIGKDNTQNKGNDEQGSASSTAGNQ